MMSEEPEKRVMGMIKKTVGGVHFTLAALGGTPEEVEDLAWSGTPECTEAFEALMRLAQSGDEKLKEAKAHFEEAKVRLNLADATSQQLREILNALSDKSASAKMLGISDMVKVAPFIYGYMHGQTPDPKQVNMVLRGLGWEKTPDGHSWMMGQGGGAFTSREAIAYLFKRSMNILAEVE